MLRKRHLGVAVVLASLLGAAPASADVPVTVRPVHGRTSTTFAIKFKPRVRSGRYRNALRLAGPVPLDRRHCRHRFVGGPAASYTPGETPPPPHRTLTWRFGPRVHTRAASNGDFRFRPQRTDGPLRRWCPGLYHGRLLVQRPQTVVDYTERVVTDWGRDRVFARFSFRVLR